MIAIIKQMEKLTETNLAISNKALDLALETVKKIPDWKKIERLGAELLDLHKQQAKEKADLEASLKGLENEKNGSGSVQKVTEVYLH